LLRPDRSSTIQVKFQLSVARGKSVFPCDQPHPKADTWSMNIQKKFDLNNDGT